MRISVVLPFLNEVDWLGTALDQVSLALREVPGEWEVLVSDSGSTDGSKEIAGVWARDSQARLIDWEGGQPSVGRAVAQAVRNATGEVVWVLPVDCQARPAAWRALQEAVAQGARAGAFPKAYHPSTVFLAAYAGLQNLIRLRVLKQSVWTNAVFFPRSQTVPTLGFLEDVQLSDAIRRRKDWVRLAPSILVSSRRYYPNRTLGRVVLNGSILAAYRFLNIDPDRLKRWYLSIK